MPEPENKMKFEHSYIKQDKINSAPDGTYSSKFQSYISDGKSALKDNIYESSKDRQEVMSKIRAGLVQRMIEINGQSVIDADKLKDEHKNLRLSMEEALSKAREASRQKKLLQARLQAEKSSYSNMDAMEASSQLAAFVADEDKKRRSDPVMRRKMNHNGQLVMPHTNENAQQEDTVDTKKWDEDYATIQSYKTLADQNTLAEHNTGFFGIFSKISKKIALNSIEKQIKQQDSIEAKQKSILKEKASSWNEKRKRDYESGSFRKHYEDFDKTISNFRALNRNKTHTDPLPDKDVKEYVGEFDLKKLDDTLDQLPANPYLKTGIAIKNKKENGGIGENDLIKGHHKITLLSEKTDDGRRLRYKFNSNFEGYAAARQFSKDNPTVLTERNSNVDKNLYSADQYEFKLKIDKKGANGEYINSEDNLEIIQAKTRFLFTGQKVNGVFLNGEFLSENRDIIKGKEDSYTVGRLNSWGYAREKEKTRKAVLKASVFMLINSRNIQEISSYEAKEQTSADKIWADIDKEISNAKSLTGDNQLKGSEEDWENIILSGDEEKINKLPESVKLKVAYNVLLGKIKADSKNVTDVGDDKTDMGKAFKVISQDPKAVMNLSLLLLSHDDHPEYWDLAKEICLEHMPYKFHLQTTTQKDKAQFRRAVNYSRADRGQIMRMALIDELLAQRKNFDITDVFGSLMPTRFKQYVEDAEGERGFKAILKRKALDGTMLKFVGDMFDCFTSTTKDMSLVSEGTSSALGIANVYVRALTSAMDTGGIMQAAVTGALESLGDEEYKVQIKNLITGKDEEKTRNTADDRRSLIGLIFNMTKVVISAVKTIMKFIKKKSDEDKEKQKQDPSYKPQSFTENKYYEGIISLLGTVASATSQMTKFFDKTAISYLTGTIKDSLTFVGNVISSIQAGVQANKIANAEEDFETLINKEEKDKTDEDKEMIEILKNNSQLQYGLSLAKRKSKDERNTMILQSVKSAGKVALGVTKTVVGGDTKIGKVFPPFAIIDGAWTGLTTIAEIGMEMYQHNENVKFNIQKMLGKKFKKVNRSVLNKVLKREAGIASADYLPDLARIFMSINTHVFLKEAKTEAEKKLGLKIAQTLLNNQKSEKNKLKNVKVSGLMTAMGVKGNFHKILKHSLA